MPDVNIQSIKKGNTAIKQISTNEFVLKVNNVRFMWENVENNDAFGELSEQIEIAEGNVICTGLGFLLRESALLEKEEVASVTVIEINQEVIDIQNELNPTIMSQLNVIRADADTYEGECDTLLLDHWDDPSEEESHEEYYNKIKKRVDSICKNIKHKKMAFWPPKEAL